MNSPLAWNGCKYPSCPRCGGCGVCLDFHFDERHPDVGGWDCVEGRCPYRWYHKIRDWFRRIIR